MTFIRSSTDGTTWTTSSITLTPDDGNSTSWVSNALNSSSVIQTVYSQDIAAVVTNNGLILRDNISDNTPNFSTVYSGVATTTWTTRTSNTTSAFESLAYGNGVWIAGGQTGSQFKSSTDTITWTTISIGSGSMLDIIYENNLWVAGISNTIFTSTDAVTWTQRTSNLSGVIYKIKYGNGLWIVSAQSGQLRTSTDTITWVTRNSNFGTSDILSLAYGNGLWVAGGGGTSIRSSTDGITWITVTSNFTTGAVGAIAYGNGLWVAGNDSNNTLRTSTDGSTWVTRTSNMSSGIIAAIWNNIWIIAGSGGSLRTSTDGITWVTKSSNFGSSYISEIAYGNDIWMIVGQAGQIRTSTNTTIITPGTKIYKGNASNNFLAIDPTIENTIYTSNNLSSFSTNSTLWHSATNGGTTISRNSIKFANNIFVMVGGSGQIRNSTDGKSWNSVVSNTSNELRHLNYGNGIWMAVGGAGTVRTSTNGTNWTTSNSNFGSTVINAVAYGNGSWLIGGYAGQIRSSTDNGVTWITQTNPFGTSTIGGIAYGNGLWVLGGFNSQIAKSTDLITWTTQVVFGGSLIRRVMYINNTWIVVTDLNRPVPGVFSTDATSWTNISFPVTNAVATPELDYSNGEWLIGLQVNTGLIGRSTNLTNWTIENTFIGQSIGGIAYGNGIFAAIVGSAAPGAVWSNRQFIKPNTILQDINFSRVILGDSGKIAINNSSNQWIVSSTGINDNFIGGAIKPTPILNIYEYLIEGNNALYKTTDFTTWTTISSPAPADVNDIIAKN